MSGPTTRPIRDDRPLAGQPRDYPSDERREQRRYDQQYNESDDEPSDLNKRGAWRRAILAMVPESFRPGARLLIGCTMCIFVAILYVVGSVELHVNPFLWSPMTASAEELRKTVARVAALERDSAMSLRIQQRARMMALQEVICRSPDVRLTLELEEMQYDYRQRNGVEYPLPACARENQ